MHDRRARRQIEPGEVLLEGGQVETAPQVERQARIVRRHHRIELSVLDLAARDAGAIWTRIVGARQALGRARRVLLLPLLEGVPAAVLGNGGTSSNAEHEAEQDTKARA